jgi:tRNA(Arg) A34 adenosine deaminase TadA
MSEENQRFMAMVLAMSEENIDAGNGGPFAAIIVRNGEIIGRGVNSVTLSHDPTAHAEINAIRQACLSISGFQLTDCDVYTSCEPCPMCLGAIYWARPRQIYYAAQREDAGLAGFEDEYIYNEMHLAPQQRTIPATQLMRGEAVKILLKWKESEIREHY